MTDDTKMQTVNSEVTDLSTLGDLLPATNRPSDVDPHDMAGTQDITRDEVRLPRLAIAQGLSPQMIPGKPEYNDKLKMFEMFNDVTGDVYGKGPVLVVPVNRHITRIEFDPDDQKVPIDRDVPAGDPRLKWDRSVTPNLPPRATEFHEFVCLLLQQGKAPEPVVVSIKATNKHQRKAASDWTTFIMLRRAAIYRGMYAISTGIGTGKTKEGQDTNYGIFIVKNAGFVPTTKVVDGQSVQNPAGLALLEMAKQFHESLEGKIITVQREAGDDSFDTSAMEAGHTTDM